MSIDKLRFVLLSDFYRNLLTKKQRDFLRLYYEEDLSFGEISERVGVSRQAVYDSIRTSELCLERYEKQLGSLSEFQHQRYVLTNILDHLQVLEAGIAGAEKQHRIQRIKTCIHDLMNSSVSQRSF